MTGLDASSEFAPVVERLVKMRLIERTREGFKLSKEGLNVADAIAGEFV